MASKSRRTARERLDREEEEAAARLAAEHADKAAAEAAAAERKRGAARRAQAMREEAERRAASAKAAEERAEAEMVEAAMQRIASRQAAEAEARERAEAEAEMAKAAAALNEQRGLAEYAGGSSTGGDGSCSSGGGDCSSPCAEDAFAVLELATGASSAQVRKAYKRLALATHPDKTLDGGTQFRRVQAAYEALCELAYQRSRERMQQRRIVCEREFKMWEERRAATAGSPASRGAAYGAAATGRAWTAPCSAAASSSWFAATQRRATEDGQGPREGLGGSGVGSVRHVRTDR